MEKEPTEKVKKELKRCLRISKILKTKGIDFWDVRIRFKQKLSIEKCRKINSLLTEIFPPKPEITIDNGFFLL